MRVASFQFIQRNLNNISARTSQANDQLGKMSSGKRVEHASEDPVAANGILNYKQELRKLEQYQNNINLAENRLRREEWALSSAETTTQQVKEIMLGANNPAITQQERDAYKEELQSRIDEMLDLANTRDEFGQYIFGGFQTDSSPFVRNPDGSVSYAGDGGQRDMMVGDNVKVGINHSGELVFGGVPNPAGDFTVAYDLQGDSRDDNLRVEEASINPQDRANFADADKYTITFEDDPANPGGIAFRIKDSLGNDFPAPGDPPEPYTPGDTIKAPGLNITIKGEAKAGDKITLSSEVQDGTGQDTRDVFDVLNRAKEWLETDGHNPSGQSEMIEILGELDAMGSHFTRVRADTGNRMQRIENQQVTHEDMSLTLNKLRGGMEDLDYAKATGEFSQTMVALQATQTMFGKVQSMSLFNYI
ncbi:flagellar hook-associated protein FlgL [Oceanimonas sp. AH20CE76]|uniref:flagellar hook-associated protein FlgL n=1 Tax=unclassified Oceanimonas TaxID=2636315 RepID=UPI002935B12B|nr:flagellar hook-associated protein FlgL [Oceanimonas sp. CAM02]MDV2856413.1 flagellar hook-associated protein FlgL [Oceanimonas sp. CAM02]